RKTGPEQRSNSPINLVNPEGIHSESWPTALRMLARPEPVAKAVGLTRGKRHDTASRQRMREIRRRLPGTNLHADAPAPAEGRYIKNDLVSLPEGGAAEEAAS